MFLVQVDRHGIPVTDLGYNIIEACKYQNWLYDKNIESVAVTQNGLKAETVVGNEFYQKVCYDSVPVGTVEFVENHMKLCGHGGIHVINIPNELNKSEYLKRRVWRTSEFGIKQEMLNGKYTKLFVKSDTKCKGYKDVVDIYSANKMPDDKYMVSEVISIEAEWRAFVFNGEIVDIRMYSGDWHRQFNAKFIEDLVKDYKNCPPAYTLDVGLMSDDNMTLIEVHNLISCGLYGFENYKILPQMIRAAYKYETKR